MNETKCVIYYTITLSPRLQTGYHLHKSNILLSNCLRGKLSYPLNILTSLHTISLMTKFM